MNKIIKTTKFVVENSTYVKINKERVIEFSKEFKHGTTNHWLRQAPFDFSHFNEEEKLRFLFIFNALSFSYWGEPKWSVVYEDKTYDGAWGMVTALGGGIKKGFPLLDFRYCSKIKKVDLKAILMANIEIPLFNERWKILQEIGAVMTSKYRGRVDTLFKEANNDAVRLLDVIVKNFPSFQDISYYKDRKIYFQKRAQLLVSDLSQLSSKYNPETWKNIDQLTACADYKLPQILRKFGILEYATLLADKIDNKIEIPHDSEEEIEIRANTIWAVELIKEQVKIKNPKITSMGIDDHLWLATQEKFPDDKPYHRTRTIDY